MNINAIISYVASAHQVRAGCNIIRKGSAPVVFDRWLHALQCGGLTLDPDQVTGRFWPLYFRA